jgi:hypothetical protein
LISERREALAKIVGTKGDAPAETVFEKLYRMATEKGGGNIERLAQARKAIGGSEWDEFASGIISRMGRDAAGEFSPDRFRTAYGNLSDSGKAILFRSTGKGDVAGHLDDIATISQRFKELNKYSNPSGTARGGSFVAGLGGLWLDPLTTLSTVATGRIAAQILARPATAAPLARWSRTYLALASTPSNSTLASFNIASRNLANTVNAELGTKLNPMDFLRQIQGPSPARTEEQK